MGVLPNGAAAPTIAVSMSDYLFDNEADVGPVSASFTFGNTGILSGDVFTAKIQPVRQWLTTTSAPTAALYEMYVTKVSGSIPNVGTLGAWLGLGTDRVYTNTKATFGTRSSVLNVKVRVIATSAEVASVNLTLTARVWLREGNQ